MTQRKQIHREGLLESIMPGWPITPEMEVLGKQWLDEKPGDTLDRWKYGDEFYKWYDKNIEVNSKTFLENMLSGKDIFREKYLHPILEKKVKGIGEKRMILDVGCGTGDTVIPHLKDSQFYLGIDPSKTLLTHINEKYGLPFIDRGDSPAEKMVRYGALPSAIPINYNKDTAFDELICSMSLQHVKDYKTSLKSMFNLLAPRAGYFIAMFNSDKRKEIEGFFDKIHKSDERSTTGDYRLPSGAMLKDVTVNFHDVEKVHNELQRYSRASTAYEAGEIFQIFEGIKKS